MASMRCDAKRHQWIVALMWTWYSWQLNYRPVICEHKLKEIMHLMASYTRIELLLFSSTQTHKCGPERPPATPSIDQPPCLVAGGHFQSPQPDPDRPQTQDLDTDAFAGMDDVLLFKYIRWKCWDQNISSAFRANGGNGTRLFCLTSTGYAKPPLNPACNWHGI